MKIEKPGKYVTRDGEVVVVKCVDMPGDYPIVGYIEWDDEEDRSVDTWDEEGFFFSSQSESDHDIVDIYRPKVKKEGWLPVYKYSNGDRRVSLRAIFDTAEEARAACMRTNSVGVAHITWEEPADE